jgi:hypothetical protein
MRKRGKERKLENKKKRRNTYKDRWKEERENTQKAVIASDRFFAYVCVVPQSCVYIF